MVSSVNHHFTGRHLDLICFATMQSEVVKKLMCSQELQYVSGLEVEMVIVQDTEIPKSIRRGIVYYLVAISVDAVHR